MYFVFGGDLELGFKYFFFFFKIFDIVVLLILNIWVISFCVILGIWLVIFVIWILIEFGIIVFVFFNFIFFKVRELLVLVMFEDMFEDMILVIVCFDEGDDWIIEGDCWIERTGDILYRKVG